jgi:hypothetical protein
MVTQRQSMADERRVDIVFEELLEPLLSDSADQVAAGWQLRSLAEASEGKGPQLLDALAQRASQLPRADPAIVGGLLRVVQSSLLNMGWPTIESLDPESIRVIEQSLPSPAPNRFLLQQLYAMIRTDASLAALVESLHENPPRQWIEAAQILSPLMQRRDWPVASIYPAILDGLQHPSLAAPLLDLASHLYREGLVGEHPAADRLAMLNLLLGEVVGRLNLFEENPRSFGDDVETVQTKLAESVALAVSLCDTLGLIGDESSIGKLTQAMDLRHRRVQCEAAGALARFDDDDGKKRLIELTAEPAARLRAIHYADELGLGELVDESFRSDKSTAEAELALWLTQPQQMGVPPTLVEVIDSRRLLWPSFDDPVDVFLVRFEYNFGDRTYSNVGIAGPAVFSMSADVANLPLDDIYAIYAGWHAEHHEIFAVQADQFNEAQLRVMESFQQHLQRVGYQELRPALLGFFLDEQAGVFTAERDNKDCLVITDGLETIDQPISGRPRPLTPEDMFNLYKGRKMLRTFNSNT